MTVFCCPSHFGPPTEFVFVGVGVRRRRVGVFMVLLAWCTVSSSVVSRGCVSSQEDRSTFNPCRNQYETKEQRVRDSCLAPVLLSTPALSAPRAQVAPIHIIPYYYYSPSSSSSAGEFTKPAMNFFGQKEEKPAGPDPLFAGACLFFVEGWRCGRPQHAACVPFMLLVGILAQ